MFTKHLRQEATVTPLAPDFLGRGVWICAAVYVSCAALRLARFNVENAGDESAHRTFTGLATPGAGAVLASLTLLHEHHSGIASDMLVRALPLVALVSGLLMVSRFRYVHIANAYLKGRRPFWQVVGVVFVVLAFLLKPAPVLAILVCGYGASGPVARLIRLVRRRGPSQPDDQQAAPADQSSPPQHRARRASEGGD